MSIFGDKDKFMSVGLYMFVGLNVGVIVKTLKYF